jgi:hypothetical protein
LFAGCDRNLVHASREIRERQRGLSARNAIHVIRAREAPTISRLPVVIVAGGCGDGSSM